MENSQARPFYLAGEWRTSDDPVEIRSPFDGRRVARVHRADEAQASEAAGKALEAFAETRRLSSQQRSEILLRLRDGVAARRGEIEAAMVAESGKPVQHVRIELGRGLLTLGLAAEEARRVGGEVIPLDLIPPYTGKLGISRRVPVGPVLAIPAFNFPFNLVAHKIAPALAAGNPVILKPAPQTPLTALLVAEIFAEIAAAGAAPPGMLSVLPCRNEVAETLVKDDRLAALTFTGSTRVGWHLKAICGKKRTLLELGGNAGALIDDDADLDAAAPRCALAAFAYAGQVCVSLQRAYVHQRVYRAFADRLVRAAEELAVGDPADEAVQVGPMISAAAVERAEALVAEAVEQGAEVLTGGRREGPFYRPTVLAGVRPDMRVCQEEVFAPLVTLAPCDDFEDGLRLVNDTPYGLAASVFTGRIAHMNRAFEDLEAGTVMINEAPLFRADNGPFGGFKDSGIGRESVRATLEAMTEVKMMVMTVGS